MNKVVKVVTFIRLVLGAALWDISAWCRQYAQDCA